MIRKFKLRNVSQQHLATVLYFNEEVLQRNVGIIVTNDLARKETWLYQDEPIEQVIANLAKRLNIGYIDYIEV